MGKFPVVSIVGRPNVGKSSVFNRLLGRKEAIVHDEAGITRDRVGGYFCIDDLWLELFDTGGIGEDVDDSFSMQVRREAFIAVELSDLILFVLDGRAGVQTIDNFLIEEFRKVKVPVLLVVNKVDNGVDKIRVQDFSNLGFDGSFFVSAEHGIGFDLLREKISEMLLSKKVGSGSDDLLDSGVDVESEGSENDVSEVPLSGIRVAVVGRPNVGKSSLINSILKKDRFLVSDVAGTTRDSGAVSYRPGEGSHRARDYVLVDTAGMQRRNRVRKSVDFFSINRSMRSIKMADVCVLVVDASFGITSQDKKIAKLIYNEGCPCVVVSNKYDLFFPELSKSDRMKLLMEDFKKELFFISYAPFVVISILSGQYLNLIFSSIDRLIKQSEVVCNTGKLNGIFQKALSEYPPPVKSGKRFKVYYVTQVNGNISKDVDSDKVLGSSDDNSKGEKKSKVNRKSFYDFSGGNRVIRVPKILIFCNNKSLVVKSYLQYLENYLRKQIEFDELPIRLVLKDKVMS